MARKRYHYPIGCVAEYPADLPAIKDIASAQRWIVSLQQDFASTHALLENLLAADENGNPLTVPHEHFQTTRKMLSFTMAKIDAVQTLLPTMHRRMNEVEGKAPSAGASRDIPLPIAKPVEEPSELYEGIEFVPSAPNGEND